MGRLRNEKAASLAGLAPVARDSGQHRGKRFIRGGRAPLRQALYMPALVAVRFDAAMKAEFSGAAEPQHSWQWALDRMLLGVMVGNDPLFDKMADLDKMIWVHPSRSADWPDYPTEERSLYEIWWALGWPYDTAVLMARMVLSNW